MYYAYNQKGREFGPYSEDEIRRRIEDGQFSPEKLIRPVSGGNWTPACTLFNLPIEVFSASVLPDSLAETQSTVTDSGSYICCRCKTQTGFSRPDNAWMLWMGWIMIVLGLFGPPLVFLWPPGAILVFIAYRQRKPTCPGCQFRDLIPLDSPGGRQMADSVRAKSARTDG